jgi:peptidoglycan/xylan/chitin deacetylase (PgdA/CDA1 family)
MLATTHVRLLVRLAIALLVVSVTFSGIVPPSPRSAEAVVLSGITGTVNASDGLELRTGASTRYRAVATLPYGTKLTIAGTCSDWFKVKALGKAGYVNSWYVTLTGTPSKEIYRGNTKRKMIALTFDAGSDLGDTEHILTILEEYGVPASFGLTGTWIAKYPDYARWIAADGNQIINHTLNHPSYTGFSDPSGPISPAKRLSQLIANEARIEAIDGLVSKPYWRPPFADRNWSVLRDVGAAGYSKTVLWTVDTYGWNGATANQIYRAVVDAAGNGVIVLMHVGSASQDAAALEPIIQTLRSRGYSFGTVAEAIAP